MFSFPRTIPLFFLVFVAFVTLQSCDSKRFFEENKRIDKNTWNNKEKVKFVVSINDIQSRYSFYINLRNSTDYPYSNIFLFLKTVFPEGDIARDTIQCQLADYSGKWTGSGITNLKFNRFLFQKGIRFPRKGQYIFEIEQAMRVTELKGISDIGIRLEKE